MKNFKNIREDSLNEKFDARKAEKTLKDFQVLYAQMKFVGIDKTIEKEFKQVYDRLASKWFGSLEMKRRDLPTELK
jgi:hypothetical protein